MAENEVELKDVEIYWAFDAPVETVWKAFTDPETAKKWSSGIAPHDSTGMEFIRHDFRVGGRYLFRSYPPGSGVHYNTGTFKKIVPMKELVYTDSFSDENGNLLSGSEYGLNYYIPPVKQVEITFEPFQEETRINLVYKGSPITNNHFYYAFTELAKSIVILTKIVERSD